MRNLFIYLVLLPMLSFSQEKKTFFGVQVGLFGGYIYNEFNIGETTSIRTNLNLALGVNNSETLMYFKGEIQPRWYYNLPKRINDEKKTAYNAANYLGLSLIYTPTSKPLSDSNISVVQSVGIIPTYGIKRNTNSGFNYEFFIGFGYDRLLDKNIVPSERNNVGVKLGFVVGFDF